MKFKHVFLLATICTIISGCSASQPAEMISTSYPTITPTQTMTPTATPRPLTADDFLIVDGNIQEKVGGEWKDVAMPAEYVGQIAYVELHEGKIYGIDTADRAEVVRNDYGEWVKYERPVVGYNIDSEEWNKQLDLPGIGYTEQKIVFSGAPLVLPDLLPTDIVALSNPDGTKINWGYQKGSYSWAKPGSSENQPLPDVDYVLTAKFSGYFLGNITRTVSGERFDGSSFSIGYQCFIFEIPYKYERQIFIVSANDSDNLSVKIVDRQNNVLNTRTMTGAELNEYLKNNMNGLIGKQLILTLDAWSKSGYPNLADSEANEPETWWKDSVDGVAFNYYFARVIESELSLPSLK